MMGHEVDVVDDGAYQVAVVGTEEDVHVANTVGAFDGLAVAARERLAVRVSAPPSCGRASPLCSQRVDCDSNRVRTSTEDGGR